MTDISVTAAEGDDLNEVAQFYELVGYGGGVSANDVTIIAKSNSCLIGAVRLCREEDFKVLRGMHIHPDYQRQGIGQMLLSHCSSYLDDSHAYCLPYAHLVAFYEQIKFAVAETSELPLLLSQRLSAYVSAGQSVLAMKRCPAQAA